MIMLSPLSEAIVLIKRPNDSKGFSYISKNKLDAQDKKQSPVYMRGK